MVLNCLFFFYQLCLASFHKYEKKTLKQGKCQNVDKDIQKFVVSFCEEYRKLGFGLKLISSKK